MLEIALSLVLLTLGGAAIGIALLAGRRSQQERERRIALVAAPGVRPVDAVGLWLKARSKRFDVRMQRVFAVGTNAIWGMKIGAVGLIGLALIGASVGWVLSRLVVGMPALFALPIAAFCGFLLPRLILLRQQRKADRDFTDLFPDAVDAISRMMRAGLPISSAVRSVSLESPPPVNAVFTMVADQMSIGAPLEQALDVSSRHIGLPDFRFFTVAVVLQHMTGGNLAETLEILSDIVRKRRAVRLKARATTAEIRVSAYVLGSLPFLIIGALLLVQPGYLAPLFVDPRGHVILLMAAGFLVAAGVTMRQMMRSVTNI
jgi:tight adherence protein B